METLAIIAGIILFIIMTKRPYRNKRTIHVNNLTFNVVITGYTWLFVFNKATKVEIISKPLTINIEL